jgi:predicted Co/Zn/Cd cation transporter (cation efflux family)
MTRYCRSRGALGRLRRLPKWAKKQLIGLGLIFLGFLIAFVCSYLLLGCNMAMLACYVISAILVLMGARAIGVKL